MLFVSFAGRSDVPYHPIYKGLLAVKPIQQKKSACFVCGCLYDRELASQVFEARAEDRQKTMADASMLQGYLMKEKSKMSLLHGLTGDINKRYFRVRTIEVNKVYQYDRYC